MQAKTLPYELLVRWNADGILAGACFATRTVYLEDGKIVFDRIADPVPVGLSSEEDALPIEDVLTPANLDAVRSVNLIAGERDAAAAERDALAIERDRLAQMLSCVSTELDVLRSQVRHRGTAPVALEAR